MNSTSIHTSTVLNNFLEQKRLAQLEFPLLSLLILFSHLQCEDLASRHRSYRELIKWLSPISRSQKQSIYIPIYFCTFEIYELGQYLKEEPSKIWQELAELPLVVPKSATRKFNVYTTQVGRSN